MSSLTHGGRTRESGRTSSGHGHTGARARGLLSGALDSPLTTFYVLLGATITLTVFGLVMVFSASSVTSIIKDRSMTAIFTKQLQYAVLGALACFLAARMPVRWWKLLAMPALLIGIILQAAVFSPIGYAVGGNRNWIAVGPLTLQPSEFTKVGLVLVGALVLANRRAHLDRAINAFVPYVIPFALVPIGLVLAGGDLGTVTVLVAIVAAILFVGGLPTRYFAIIGGVGIVGLAGLVLTSAHRMMRFKAMFTGCDDADSLQCGQATHAKYAFADGGWWGVGLGGSREKWAWLSEAHNDFIFAVVGEELGLPGTLAVLVLFAMLAWACARIVMRSTDQFVRIAAAGIMAWIVVQAMVNIGSVTGVLPVIGVPLPFISAGGTSLITTLFAVGMLLSFARAEPGAREMLAARPSIWRRSMSVLPSRRSTSGPQSRTLVPRVPSRDSSRKTSRNTSGRRATGSRGPRS